MKKIRMLAVILVVVGAALLELPSASAKREKPTVSPDDPTYQLYQLLDNSYGGMLKDFYVLADIYADPQKPGNQLQHVLRVDYDKSHFFGRLRIQVRSVGKLTPAQLKTYDPKQIYDFAEQDEAEFAKINPGPLGQTGDLYMHTKGNRPLAPAPVTAKVTKQYDTFITEYILPALKK
jgi:hypothetical protein